MKYDDASWHYQGDCPEDLPEDNAFIHIGVFLCWCIHGDLLSDEYRLDYPDEIEEARARAVTPSHAIKVADGQLVSDMLSDVGSSFARWYYKDESDQDQEVPKYLSEFPWRHTRSTRVNPRTTGQTHGSSTT
ncbi:MAG: hypothetical protein AAGD00_01450 [Planctomycetota bacterium]